MRIRRNAVWALRAVAAVALERRQEGRTYKLYNRFFDGGYQFAVRLCAD